MRAAKSFSSVQSVNSSNDELFKSSNSSTAGGSSDDLSSEDLSACPYCQHPFDEEARVPKFLPCFHTFCLCCLKALSSSTVVVTCPHCHRTHTCNQGVDKLESNIHALHLAKLAAKAEKEPKLHENKGLVESWCFTCQSVANLVCYFNTVPKHLVVNCGSCSLKEVEELQGLLREMPLQKSLAIEKRKQIQVHLKSVLQSLMQVENGVKDMMFKNDRHLSGLISLSDNILDLPPPPDLNGSGLKLSTMRESVVKVAHQLKESLEEGTRLADEMEMQKRIRILLHLRSAENNQPVPTFALFEDGFYANWAMTETNLSTTDRNLMVLSHLVFTILKRWNIPLPVRTNRTASVGGLFYSSKSLLMTEPIMKPNYSIAPFQRHLPGILPSAAHPSTMSVAHRKPPSPQKQNQQFASSNPSEAMNIVNKISPISDGIWGSAPILSYSQVLNLPKQVQRASSLPLHTRGNEKNNESGLLPSIIFRFEERGNPKYNLPSKFLGEVHVRVFLKTHAGFVRQLTGYCRKVKELTRKIAKASPGMFVTLQSENAAMVEGVPDLITLVDWESSERATDALDVGINVAVEEEGRIVGWKFIFQIDEFKPNNMEVSMLFGKVTSGRDVLHRLSSRTKHDRFNLIVTVKTA